MTSSSTATGAQVRTAAVICWSHSLDVHRAGPGETTVPADHVDPCPRANATCPGVVVAVDGLPGAGRHAGRRQRLHPAAAGSWRGCSPSRSTPRPQDEDVVAPRHDRAASSADDASWYASSGLLPCWRATT